MSRLQAIARQLKLDKQPAPQQSTGFGAAVEGIVERAVEKFISESLAEKKQELLKQLPDFDRTPRYTDYKQIPPVPTTAPAKDLTATLTRDERGRAKFIEIGNLKLEVQRDSLGRALRLVQVEDK